MNITRLRKWLDDCIEPNSNNIYLDLLNQLKPEDIEGTINVAEFAKVLIEKSKKWDKEIDKIIN